MHHDARDAIGSALTPLSMVILVNTVTVQYRKVQCLEHAKLLNSQVQQTQDLKKGSRRALLG